MTTRPMAASRVAAGGSGLSGTDPLLSLTNEQARPGTRAGAGFFIGTCSGVSVCLGDAGAEDAQRDRGPFAAGKGRASLNPL